jgi:hypothetical protein
MAAAFCRGASRMSTRFLTIAVFCGCLAAAAIWFFSNFERRTEKEWVGFQGKARRDNWLAAERLLQRMGASATAVRSLPELGSLPGSATLLLPGGRQALNTQMRNRILLWVARGGRLIVEAEPPYMRDALLDALGVQRKLIKLPQKKKRDDEEDDDKYGYQMPVRVALPAELEPVTVIMKRGIDLRSKKPLAQFGYRETNAALFLSHGRGRVLVLNDFGGFSNDSIGEHDHAEFLWHMVRVDEGAPSAYFFFDPQKLSLLQWLRENAWAAIAGGALLVLIWLWRAVPRFGPIVPDPDRARRRLLDHLRASGRFLWKHGGSRRLLEAAREACMRRIARAHPELVVAADAQRQTRLTELLGLDAEQSRLLFSHDVPVRALDFIRTIQVYQTVHETLALKRAALHQAGTQPKRETQ